jgi:hypothetical protein
MDELDASDPFTGLGVVVCAGDLTTMDVAGADDVRPTGTAPSARSSA